MVHCGMKIILIDKKGSNLHYVNFVVKNLSNQKDGIVKPLT